MIRPRTPWEAVDLGFGLARREARAVWGAWLVAAVPVHLVVWALAYAAAGAAAPALALFALWWLKPLFERAPLLVLSRALFGATPRVRDVARALPRLWLRHGLADLTLGRPGLSRSFTLPVTQLEGLTGRARRRRMDLLARTTRGRSEMLTTTCMVFEAGAALALFALLALLVPEEHTGAARRALAAALGEGGEASPAGCALLGGLYLGALTAVEPLYVAGGFGLYVNRRTHLEGWDIELAFRRLARRLSQLAVAVVLAAACLGGAAWAQQTPTGRPDPQEAIQEILRDPAFGRTEERPVRRLRRADVPEGPDEGAGFDPGAGALLGELLRAGALVGLGLAVLAVIVYGARRAQEAAREEGGFLGPEVVAGLDVRPESLPADVAGAARARWLAGDAPGALSLLYRGALVCLIARHRLAIGRGATEGDCLAAVRAAGGPREDFAELTRAWQQVAYAGRRPTDAVALGLCDRWARHLEAP